MEDYYNSKEVNDAWEEWEYEKFLKRKAVEAETGKKFTEGGDDKVAEN